MLEDLSYKVSILKGSVPKVIVIGVLLLVVFILFCFKFLPNIYLKYKTQLPPLTQESIPTDLSQGDSDIIFCEISGAVNEPNVYPILSKQRIFEIVKLAKGFSKYADINWVSKNLNLSMKIKDECKIYIPFIWDLAFNNTSVSKYTLNNNINESSSLSITVPNEDGVEEKGKQDIDDNKVYLSDTSLINVNSCDTTALTSLKGIGPAYASRIIQGRPYKDFAEFLTMSKVPATILEGLKDRITF